MISAILKYIAGGLLFVCIVLGIGLHLERVHSAKLSNRVAELNQLRAADRASYEAAQKAAEAEAEARLDRTQADQQRITHEVSSDYARQLADLRARFDRLRSAPKANPGQPQDPAVPGSGNPAGGADDSTGERLSPSERQIAAEISLRLRALQDWVTKQSHVDPNR